MFDLLSAFFAKKMKTKQSYLCLISVLFFPNLTTFIYTVYSQKTQKRVKNIFIQYIPKTQKKELKHGISTKTAVIHKSLLHLIFLSNVFRT